MCSKTLCFLTALISIVITASCATHLATARRATVRQSVTSSAGGERLATAPQSVTRSAVSAALSAESLQGKYRASSIYQPGVFYQLSVEGDLLSTVEHSDRGILACSGKFVIAGNVVTSNLECKNGTKWVQKIDFSGVDFENDNFEALVMSSLFDYQELPMTFEREKASSDKRPPGATSDNWPPLWGNASRSMCEWIVSMGYVSQHVQVSVDDDTLIPAYSCEWLQTEKNNDYKLEELKRMVKFLKYHWSCGSFCMSQIDSLLSGHSNNSLQSLLYSLEYIKAGMTNNMLNRARQEEDHKRQEEERKRNEERKWKPARAW